MATEWGTRPSNGTMGEMMMRQLCNRCTVDHDLGEHQPDGGNEGGCTIVALAMCGESPPELGYDLDTGIWQCEAFAGPCPCYRDGR